MTKHTPFRDYLIPDETAEPPESGRYAFTALISAVTAIDFDIQAILDALALKSNVGHGHVIADVEGLAGALDSKMPSSRVFKLDDLSDVDGAEGAQEGYILVKTPTGWIPQSALAAVGNHEHTIAQVFGLSTELAARASLVDGKVPASQLPALTTTATVGAALAGANGKGTPADGDRFSGVLSGASTVFWTTWGNIKATLKAYFDGFYYLKSEVNSIVAGSMDGRTYPRKVGGGDINFNWSGQGGQPTWLWGGADGTNMYVYNPSNFNVNSVGGWTQATISNQIETRASAWGAAHAAAVAGPGGPSQSWQGVARNSSQWYLNNTGRPIVLTVHGVATARIEIAVNNDQGVPVVVAMAQSGVNGCAAVIANNQYYRHISAGGFNTWEMR